MLKRTLFLSVFFVLAHSFRDIPLCKTDENIAPLKRLESAPLACVHVTFEPPRNASRRVMVQALNGDMSVDIEDMRVDNGDTTIVNNDDNAGNKVEVEGDKNEGGKLEKGVFLNVENSKKDNKKIDNKKKKKKKKKAAVDLLNDDGDKDTGNVPVHLRNRTQVSPFYPKVDKYAMMSVGGSGEFMRNSSIDASFVKVQIEIGGVVSSPRTWGYQSKFVPFWTIRVGVDKGIIKGLEWDDFGCGTCSEDGYCVVDSALKFDKKEEKFVESEVENCAAAPPEGESRSMCTSSDGEDDKVPCDLKIYVVWRGTDKSGQQLETDGYRLSEMGKYSINSVYRSGKNMIFSNAPKRYAPARSVMAAAIAVIMLIAW